MSNKDELDVQWDADVIEFWQASLQSYKTCHDGEKSKDTDSETIAYNLIDSLPKRKEKLKAPSSSIGSSEPPLSFSEPTIQKLQNNSAPRPPGKPESHIEREDKRARMTDRSEEHADELYSRLQTPAKRKAPVVSKNSNLPPVKRNAQIDKLEEEQEEEQEEDEEEDEEEEEHIYENTSKKARYQDNQQEYYYQHPQYAAAPAPPPMPPSMPTQDNEAFSNLIMSWYYAGYYTGLYQARQR
ncbi:hypothetical protein PS15p_204263 [Mucor circinelloides]